MKAFLQLERLYDDVEFVEEFVSHMLELDAIWLEDAYKRKAAADKKQSQSVKGGKGRRH